jgi:hypothetical protein
MRKLLCALLSITMVMSAEAWCDTTSTTSTDSKMQKPMKVKRCLFPKSRKRAPNWICEVHNDTAVGSAAKSKAGIAFMEQMAVADARTHLAQKLHGSVQEKSADHNGTVITTTTNGTLLDTTLMESAYGPNGRLYVLIGIAATTPPAQ